MVTVCRRRGCLERDGDGSFALLRRRQEKVQSSVIEKQSHGSCLSVVVFFIFYFDMNICFSIRLLIKKRKSEED